MPDTKGEIMRREKNSVDYFPHDSHASSGNTLTILENKYGYDGYGFWFKLLERLGLADGHYLDCNDTVLWHLLLVNLGVSTGKMHLTTADKAIELIELLCNLGAIDSDLWHKHKTIWCPNFVDNVKDAYKNRRRDPPLAPVFEADKVITTGNKAITTAGGTQKKRKERKGNKEETLFAIFWAEYPKKKAKIKAATAFDNAIEEYDGDKDAFVELLLKAISEQVESEDWLREDGRFIPYPEAWLNGKRWQDEPAKEKVSRYKRLSK